MKIVFEFFYNFLDNYVHRVRIINYLKKIKLQLNYIIDVGSHKGESLETFKKINKNSNIFCFEPQVDCFYFLKKKFKFEKNIRIFNYALSNKKGKKVIFKNILSTTSTFSKLNFKSKHFKIKSTVLNNKSAGFFAKNKVRINTLSFFIKKYKIKKVDLLKIDTEGHELQVLLGSKKILKNIKLILIERNLTDYYLNYDYSKIERLLHINYFKKIRSFKFPFMQYQDILYLNTKLNNS